MMTRQCRLTADVQLLSRRQFARSIVNCLSHFHQMLLLSEAVALHHGTEALSAAVMSVCAS